MPRPIKPPKGTTHDEPSWRERLKEVAAAYEAKGGKKGIYQRAVMDFMRWTSPSGQTPDIVQKNEIADSASRRTNLANKYIGKVGVWLSTYCATGQLLLIWVPDVSQIGDKSILTHDFVVQVESGHRYTYAPATVMAILQRGYPVG